jgi:hypothetical protein
MNVVHKLGEGKESIGYVHAHENSIADESKVDKITPSKRG